MRIDEIIKMKQSEFTMEKDLQLHGYEKAEVHSASFLPDHIRWLVVKDRSDIKIGLIDTTAFSDLSSYEKRTLASLEKSLAKNPENAGIARTLEALTKRRDKLRSSPRVIGYLCLGPYPRFPIPKAMEVESILVSSDYSNRGLAKALYRLAMQTLGFTLMTGSEQTPGGRRNWVSIAKMPEVDVTGFIELETTDHEDLDDETIDKVMSMGAQHIGTSKTSYNEREYFAFDVAHTGTGKELKAGTAKQLKLYTDQTERVNANVGMYAQWR